MNLQSCVVFYISGFELYLHVMILIKICLNKMITLMEVDGGGEIELFCII